MRRKRWKNLCQLAVNWKSSKCFGNWDRPAFGRSANGCARTTNSPSRPFRRFCGSWTTRDSYRTKPGTAFVYTPRYSRERATSRFVEQVFDGAMDQVIVSMLSTTDASPEELKQLEKIIAQSRRRKERQNRQKKEP